MSATIRITVLHLGGREICAEIARDMGLTAGAIVGPLAAEFLGAVLDVLDAVAA